MKRRPLPAAARSRQRGAATLVIVMVLFFIVALTAAYTSRNMIFEQKTSANQYRSTQAFEAAEAGLEWALTMLSGGRLEDDCTAHTALTAPPAPTTPPTKASFSQRYLKIEVNTPTVIDGTVTTTRTTAATDAAPRLWPTCVFDGAQWRCSCPINVEAGPDITTNPSYAGPRPAFRVRLLAYDLANPTSTLNPPNKPYLIRVESMGCTRYDENCLNFGTTSIGGEGVAVVSTLVALRNALAMPPTAAITARGNVKGTASQPIAVVNTDTDAAGITVRSGGTVSHVTATSLPTTPGDESIFTGNPALASLYATASQIAVAPELAERMFAATFGMRRLAYFQQPGLRKCQHDPCTAAHVNELLANNPHRAIWVAGDLRVDGDIGNANDPAVLVVEGDLEVTGAGSHQLFGLIFMSKSDADIDTDAGSTLTLQGALVAERHLEVSGGGAVSVQYDASTLARLRSTYGTFVRLPGGWHDWVGP